MTTVNINTINNIKDTVNQTATVFFDFIRPSILMIGPWDDYFTIIKTQYRWAGHVFSPPGRIKRNTTLIIVNNLHYFNQVVAMLNSSGINAAIIVYDDSEIIPVEQRTASKNKVCYLRSSSPRYINGHIRSMLQLQRWFLGYTENHPLIITDLKLHERMNQIISSMDRGLPINIKTGNSYHFYLLFKTAAKNTQYKLTCYVENVESFDRLVSYNYTTLLLNVNSIEEYNQYLKKPLMEYCVVFISNFEIEDEKMYMAFDMGGLTKSKPVFFLTAYYYSLRQNLEDENNRTRFVQMGDLNKLYNEVENIFEFYDKLKAHHKANTLRFKNMAPMIRDAFYGVHPLDDLVDHLVGSIYKEFFEQTNFALEHAEMVSSVKRSTLQPKLEKIKVDKVED